MPGCNHSKDRWIVFLERARNISNSDAAMKIQREILNKSSNASKKMSNPAILFLFLDVLRTSLASARNIWADKLLQPIVDGSRVIQAIHWV